MSSEHAPLLQWSNLTYSVADEKDTRKNLIYSVSGFVGSGETLAILGGSGAGKTTILNILSGNISSSGLSGEVLFKGASRPANWKKVVGYVQQSDLMMSCVTVKESLMFSSELRGIPRPYEENAKLVDEAIHTLGLRTCEDNIVTSVLKGDEISGGQKKRVAVGNEVVADCQILAMDEPTTGLDSFTASSLVAAITECVRKRGIAAILTIHQPRLEVLKLFDRIMFMSQGRVICMGNFEFVLKYFQGLGYPCPTSMNPADYFLDISTADHRNELLKENSMVRIQTLIESWESYEEKHPTKCLRSSSPKEAASTPTRSWWYQYKTLFKRDLKSMLRDGITVPGIIFQALFVTLLCCIVFFQVFKSNSAAFNILGALYTIPVNVIFPVITPILLWFPTNRLLIERENATGAYTLSALFFARCSTYLPLSWLRTFVTTAIQYWIIGFRPGFEYFLMFNWLMMCLVFTSVGIGMCIGTIVPDQKLTQIIAPVFLGTFMYFGGVMSSGSSIPWVFGWLKYLSLNYWGSQGFILSQLKGLPATQIGSGGGPSGDAILASNQFNVTLEPWLCSLMLLCIGAIFYLVGALVIGRNYRAKINI